MKSKHHPPDPGLLELLMVALKRTRCATCASLKYDDPNVSAAVFDDMAKKWVHLYPDGSLLTVCLDPELAPLGRLIIAHEAEAPQPGRLVLLPWDVIKEQYDLMCDKIRIALDRVDVKTPPKVELDHMYQRREIYRKALWP